MFILLSNSIKQSFLTCHDIRSFLLSQKFHYHTHKYLLLLPILSQKNSVHILHCCSFRIDFNIILFPTPTFSRRFLFLSFPHKILVCVLLFLHTFRPCLLYRILRKSITHLRYFNLIKYAYLSWITL